MSVDAYPFSVLSLCSGAGGLDLGIGLAVPHARTICYVEIDAYACEILATRMEEECLDAAPVWSNLRTFDGAAWRGLVDLLTGGYPCQPFSVAGKQLGEKDPRHLWPEVARIIEECDPEWCFFENVGGHLRLGFREVAGELHRMGYRVAAGLFTAEEVGATHKRERLFIMAHRSGAEWRPGDGIIGEGGAIDRIGGGGAPLADAERGAAERRRYDLAAAPCGTQSEARQRERIRADAGNGSIGVAHPIGRQQARWSGGCNGASGAGAHDQPAGSGAQLGDSNNTRLAIGREPAIGRGNIWDEGSPAFPPGPGDVRTWGEILARWPEVEPALCGMVDGMAPRVDRLRLTGNGVVPDVAALAFRTLYAELAGE